MWKNIPKILSSYSNITNPYLKLIRFDKPIGTYLLFWPGSWALTLGSKVSNDVTPFYPNEYFSINLPDFKLFTYFICGTFFMRNAGCIINDYFDKEIDSHVLRTRERPLASNKLSSLKAMSLLLVNLSLALAILLKLNYLTIITGICSIIPTITYPLAKRYVNWPQLHLGIIFNWGILMGWTATLDDFQPILPLLLLLNAGISWTVLYDTIYAHQDKHFDKKLKLNSTAIYFEKNPKLFFNILATIHSISMFQVGNILNLSYTYLGIILFNSLSIYYNVYKVNVEIPKSCNDFFKKCNFIGFLYFLSFLFA